MSKTHNIVDVTYAQTGLSTSTDGLGMREMQEKAYANRGSQYLLLKAPPASGKSRALMFIALDKLFNQGLRKAIVAVPERSIGASFSNTDLTSHGFFADWEIKDHNNLCTPGNDKSKVQSLVDFLDSDDALLVCTHATLRFAHDQIEETKFNDVLLAIDEFHHVSADADNRLGELVRSVMANTNAHIVAMTGSYFRGDAAPVLTPEDEAKFTKVTYNYYDQLNGYTHLKTLGIGYHFYQGTYTDAINEVLDTDKKTILHIPHVASGESTKDKYNEVNLIIDQIGDKVVMDSETGIQHVTRHGDGKIIKVADLVNDDPKQREKVAAYLREIETEDDIDLIIALGMAKEGFDWPYCEHALTIGYRGSLTEVIQIIGRCTRDSDNKTHAQFTNLIAQPEADDTDVNIAVNNMLKAITVSLLMEQVVAPNFKFKAKNLDTADATPPDEMHIAGFKEPTTPRVAALIETDLNDMKAKLFQEQQMLTAMPGNTDPERMNKILIPQIIRKHHPELTEDEIESYRQHVVVDSAVKNGEIKEVDGKKFVKMANKFVNIDDLHIDLIDQVNPFQKAFEILSKSVTSNTLRMIKDLVDENKIQMSDEDAILLWPKVKEFRATEGREPDLASGDPRERELAEARLYIQKKRRELDV